MGEESCVRGETGVCTRYTAIRQKYSAAPTKGTESGTVDGGNSNFNQRGKQEWDSNTGVVEATILFLFAFLYVQRRRIIFYIYQSVYVEHFKRDYRFIRTFARGCRI